MREAQAKATGELRAAPQHTRLGTRDTAMVVPHTTPSDICLSVEHVSKRFGGVVAVDDCSLQVRQGGITGLIGPNGAGKTTLFHLLAGVYRPDAGRIVLHGQRIDGLAPPQIFARRVARTFQMARVLPRMSVLDNLRLVPAQQAGERLWSVCFQPRRVAAQERALTAQAEAILERVQLYPLRHADAATLSGGQRKLLELARVMMADAQVILLDEPGAGVNPTLMRQLVQHIRAMQAEGRTFVLIEHDMDLVRELCQPVIVMVQGRPLTEGTPEDVCRDPRVLEAYLGA